MKHMGAALAMKQDRFGAVLNRHEIMAMRGLSRQDIDDALNAVFDVIEPVQSHFLWRLQLRNPGDELVQDVATDGGATHLQSVCFFATVGDIIVSQIALRLPDLLHHYAKQLATKDDASLNQFIVTAVAEKISAMRAEFLFQGTCGPHQPPDV